MNRKRQLSGINSYEKELGFDLEKWLLDRIEEKGRLRWLDICCGEGHALSSFGKRCIELGIDDQIELIGVDLVGMFVLNNAQEYPFLQFITTAVEQWETNLSFDLITCIHGLHYIGDKLGCLQSVCTWLAKDGQFWGSLDLNDIRSPERKPWKKYLVQEWQQSTWTFLQRKHLLHIDGNQVWNNSFIYLGANDEAGTNYSGQEIVHSYYELKK